MRLASLFAVAVSLVFATTAHADDIAVRTDQLKNNKSYKVRLSAALWLAKKRDTRVVVAFTEAIDQAREKEKNIRRIAAKSLGKLITAETPAQERRQARAALEWTAKNDSSSRVRRSAKRSLKRLAALPPPKAKPVPLLVKAKYVFINIAKPSMGKHEMPKGTKKLLRTQIRKVLGRKTPRYQLAWKTDKLPTQAELVREKTRAWLVETQLTELEVLKKGRSVDVKCNLTIRVSPWAGRDAQLRWTAHDTAAASGGAMVTNLNSPQGIALAKQECVLAVAEQITSRQVVPFLKRRNKKTASSRTRSSKLPKRSARRDGVKR